MRFRALALFAAALVAVLGVAACSDVVAGDSLVVNAAAYGDGAPISQFGTAESTVSGVTLQGFSGGAPCDYFRFEQSAWDRFHPSRISFAWSGNNITPCMLVNGQKRTGSALVLKYHDDLAALTKFFAAKGVKVIFSAPLCRDPAFASFWPNGDPAFRTMESRLAASFAAQHFHVAYSEYAALQVCPAWQFLPQYHKTGDGLHLNPTGGAIYATALRFESKHTLIP